MRNKILFTTLVMSLLGCGSSDATDSGGGSPGPVAAAPIAQSDFVAAYAEAYCKNLEPCCQADNLPFKGDECRKNSVTANTAVLKGRLAVAGAVYDPIGGGACIAALASESATCTRTPDSRRALDTACGRITRNTKAVGEACKLDRDCAPGAGNCDIHHQVCALPVALAPHLTAGAACAESCGTTGMDCYNPPDPKTGVPTPYDPSHPLACYQSDGLTCERVSRICVKPSAIGESCATNYCVTGSFCDNKVCQALLADGTPCAGIDPDKSCASGYCGGGVCATISVTDHEACQGS